MQGGGDIRVGFYGKHEQNVCLLDLQFETLVILGAGPLASADGNYYLLCTHYPEEKSGLTSFFH